MRILLTGATGYLGSRLCKQLSDEGFTVIALHLNHLEKIQLPVDESRVEKVYLSDVSVDEIIHHSKIDGVIHTATLYGRTQESVIDMIQANVIFPVSIMSACEKYNVGFFVNTSSILNKNINAYSLTKSHVVDWMEQFKGRIKMIDMCLDHFYGPNDSTIKFVSRMIANLAQNVPEIDLTEGNQTRDFIYIDDVVSAYMTVLRHVTELPSDKINHFEVGTNVRTSIKELMLKIKKLTRSSSRLNFGAVPFRENEVLEYEVDTRALRRLGWTPRISLDDGLKKTILAR